MQRDLRQGGICPTNHRFVFMFLIKLPREFSVELLSAEMILGTECVEERPQLRSRSVGGSSAGTTYPGSWPRRRRQPRGSDSV